MKAILTHSAWLWAWMVTASTSRWEALPWPERVPVKSCQWLHRTYSAPCDSRPPATGLPHNSVSVSPLKYSGRLCLAKQFPSIRSAFISANVAWTMLILAVDWYGCLKVDEERRRSRRSFYYVPYVRAHMFSIVICVRKNDRIIFGVTLRTISSVHSGSCPRSF